MLELKNIKKNYYVGEQTISALKGISISFRDCEFVSILGQSGCGKTTMMNIIGGLDKATDGEIFLNGVSTKNFKETDWDDYRNSKIGFVFQSYNLISHLNILTNVELALTISGVTGEERTIRAKQALDRVGLKDHYYKRPNQLSGGQMQRVAIARAIVNEPDILLADEPTGATDSETSVQVMDILKEISQEKLVIMVTHNAELAEKYSTRIVRILDGEIISDNNPIDDETAINTDEENTEIIEPVDDNITSTDDTETVEIISTNSSDIDEEIDEEIAPENVAEITPEIAVENQQNDANDGIANAKPKKSRKRKKGASMSFFTSIKLSFRNLINKRGRSVLTAIAGSIGIISIALILAVNNGFNLYIDDFEKQSMSKYPITISSGEFSVLSTFEEFLGGDELDSDKLDIGSILNVFTGDSTERKAFTNEELVYVYGQFSGMFKAMQENMSKTKDISKFKDHLEKNFDSKLGVVKYNNNSVVSKNND
ncbi:MAG: ABC transporter ATP-binding protein, partial [Clostridia bacterium]|nr:ABC transporter ATP-binding protein [Clostridia bacterium]